jgi:hypothetical protein
MALGARHVVSLGKTAEELRQGRKGRRLPTTDVDVATGRERERERERESLNDWGENVYMILLKGKFFKCDTRTKDRTTVVES